jgi:hypothetical protein
MEINGKLIAQIERHDDGDIVVWMSDEGRLFYGVEAAEIRFGHDSYTVLADGAEVDLEVSVEPGSPEDGEIAVEYARRKPVAAVADAFEIYRASQAA